MAAPNPLAGRKAFVTGGAKGIGAAIARRLAADGALVTIADLDMEAAQALANGIWARAVRLDVADLAQVAEVMAEHGPVDILVNNAAANGYRPFTEWTTKQLDVAFQVNVRAPWQLMADVAPSMRARGRGWIVNVTSFAAELPPGPPFPSNMVALEGSGYGVSKAALNRLTVSVAAELHDAGVAVNALAPQSAIATPHLVAEGRLQTDHFEPLETMAEAVLALSTCDPQGLSGRIERSLELLVELQRPVRGLDSVALVDGWQPGDLPEVIERQAAMLEARGWPSPFTPR